MNLTQLKLKRFQKKKKLYNSIWICLYITLAMIVLAGCLFVLVELNMMHQGKIVFYSLKTAHYTAGEPTQVSLADEAPLLVFANEGLVFGDANRVIFASSGKKEVFFTSWENGWNDKLSVFLDKNTDYLNSEIISFSVSDSFSENLTNNLAKVSEVFKDRKKKYSKNEALEFVIFSIKPSLVKDDYVYK